MAVFDALKNWAIPEISFFFIGFSKYSTDFSTAFSTGGVENFLP